MGKGLMTAPRETVLPKKKDSGRKEKGVGKESAEPRDLAGVIGKSACTTDDLEKVIRRSFSDFGLEVRMPQPDERPWTAPEGGSLYILLGSRKASGFLFPSFCSPIVRLGMLPFLNYLRRRFDT